MNAPTPMMEQYRRIKAEHPDAILFFRLGDFYEMFGDDAKEASRILGLTLTSRFKGDRVMPMAGIPHFSAETYLRRLLRAGRKVAMCDQVEDASQAKGLVDRAVTRVLTPGTLTEDGLLEGTEANYIAAVAPGPKSWGLAWADLSTGEFYLTEGPPEEVGDRVAAIGPSEVLLPAGASGPDDPVVQRIDDAGATLRTPHPDWTFEPEEAERSLCRHFGTHNLEGFGCTGTGPGVGAAGALLDYLRETQKTDLRHMRRLIPLRKEGTMLLDRPTREALEIVASRGPGGRAHSVMGILDHTRTAMGSRRLHAALLAPLIELGPIRERQTAVARLFEDPLARRDLRETLSRVHDLERLAARLGAGRANARDLVAIRASIEVVPVLRARLAGLGPGTLGSVHDRLRPEEDLVRRIREVLVDQPPAAIQEGGLIRSGYDEELDRLRALQSDGKSWIARFQKDEAERSGIPSLKVGFNKVFGYYIEVTNAHQGKAPAHYLRKQTLKNAERYITPELKDRETEVLHAEESSRRREYDLFLELREEAATRVREIQETAEAVGDLDFLTSLAEAAEVHRYICPTIEVSGRLHLRDARHPVLEQVLRERFVPNDLTLDADADRLVLVTGPNMAGKSTMLRQAALILLMAQVGSFVPAREAVLGIADRIFTRVGASDDISRGRSTFMVEMTETAGILHGATKRSLVILDEVGRGTSTFDGVSIAWAVAEHLHDRIGCRTLFATHYHELPELAATLPGVRNLHVAVREWENRIVFLHRLAEGPTDRSYGIHVAAMAGLPREVIDRAAGILARLEAQAVRPDGKPSFVPRVRKPPAGAMTQLSLFGNLPHPVAEALRRIDPETIAPLEALRQLKALRDLLDE